MWNYWIRPQKTFLPTLKTKIAYGEKVNILFYFSHFLFLLSQFMYIFFLFNVFCGVYVAGFLFVCFVLMGRKMIQRERLENYIGFLRDFFRFSVHFVFNACW